jgi:hypothetical protein
MNHAYGIKRFILKEEAELPSVGYNDVITVKKINLNTFHYIVNVNKKRRELYPILLFRKTSISKNNR